MEDWKTHTATIPGEAHRRLAKGRGARPTSGVDNQKCGGWDADLMVASVLGCVCKRLVRLGAWLGGWTVGPCG